MITMAEVRQLVNSDPTQEIELDIYRKTVIADFEEQTNILWSAGTGRDKLFIIEEQIDRKNSLFLPAVNVSNLSIKTWQLDQKESEATTLVFEEDYFFFECDNFSGVQINAWNAWCHHVRVTYDSGYPDGQLPAALQDIKLALIKQLQFMCQRLSGEKLIEKQQSFEKGSTSYEAAHYHPFYQKVVENRRFKVLG